MTDHVTKHIDSLLNAPGTQLTWDDWDHLAEVEDCPLCGYVLRLWYVTVYDTHGDYLDSLNCKKCLRCEYKKFFAEIDLDQ